MGHINKFYGDKWGNINKFYGDKWGNIITDNNNRNYLSLLRGQSGDGAYFFFYFNWIFKN
jgi:hypothetical protein